MIKQTADEFIADLKAIAPRFGDGLPRALEECRPKLLEAFNENFASQSSAGQAWPPRKDQGFSHPLLNLSGSLRAAATGQGAGHVERITQEGDVHVLELGVDKTAGGGGIPGAAVHNYGATIRPVKAQYLSWVDSAGGRRFAKQVTIPQREYLVASDETLDQCGEIMADNLLGELA